VVSLLVDCDESLTWGGLNLNLEHFRGSTTFTLFMWRIVFACLVVCRCGMAGSDEDRGRSRKPDAEDLRWSHRSGTRWSDDQEVG
jgi:hypothetical protein